MFLKYMYQKLVYSYIRYKYFKFKCINIKKKKTFHTLDRVLLVMDILNFKKR